MSEKGTSRLPEEREDGIVQQPVSQFDHTSRSYVELLDSLKLRIQQARTKALLSVNRELTTLYWAIGHQIVEAQNREGWGTSMINRLAHDLRSALPSNRGLSPRNLWRMRAFFLAYPASEVSLPQPVADLASSFLPQPVAEIPWGHNIALIEKIKDPEQRLWYAAQTIEHGWSRAVLVHQIESNLYERYGHMDEPQRKLRRHLRLCLATRGAAERQRVARCVEQELLDSLKNDPGVIVDRKRNAPPKRDVEPAMLSLAELWLSIQRERQPIQVCSRATNQSRISYVS